MTRIAFIGFGEAGQAFAATLQKAGAEAITAFDIRQGADREPLAQAAQSLGVTLCDTSEQALQGAHWVFSAVTAAQSLNAVSPLRLARGQVLIDINSVSPARKVETAALVTGQGARYVDMAVMTPVHPKGHHCPTLVAGANIDAALAALGFAFENVGDQVGTATGIKMVRSLFVKGLEALTLQTLLAADSAGCLDRIMASLSASYPGLGWPGFAAYQAERVATHGCRRAEEMRESAVTLNDLGHPQGAGLAAATADFQDRIGRLGLKLEDKDLAIILRQIAQARA